MVVNILHVRNTSFIHCISFLIIVLTQCTVDFETFAVCGAIYRVANCMNTFLAYLRLCIKRPTFSFCIGVSRVKRCTHGVLQAGGLDYVQLSQKKI